MTDQAIKIRHNPYDGDVETKLTPLDELREYRNELLTECDWRACSDRTMSEDWKTYRQALRDITTQSDPYNITWPTIPS